MDTPTADEHRRKLKANFDALAPTYDNLGFLRSCADRLVENAPLRPGARVLDVATGTGAVAFGAARRVGPTGRVIGVDLSGEMLAHARHKLDAAAATNVEFREADAEHLDFPDASFDVVLCASSLPFIPNMLGAVREWRRVLRPDGRVGFSGFGPSFLQPLRRLWEERLSRYGVEAAPLPMHRLGDAEACETLLRDAGFARVEVKTEQLGYYARTAEERWADIDAGMEGKPLLRLTASQRERIEAEHLGELSELVTADGLWIDVPAIFAFGS